MSPGNFDDSPQMTRSHSKQSSQLTVKGAIMGSSTNTQPLILALKRVMIMPTVVYASSEAAVKELSNLTGIRQVATDAVSVVTRPDIYVVFIAGAIKERKQLVTVSNMFSFPCKSKLVPNVVFGSRQRRQACHRGVPCVSQSHRPSGDACSVLAETEGTHVAAHVLHGQFPLEVSAHLASHAQPLPQGLLR